MYGTPKGVTKLAIPLAKPNIPKAVGNDREEAGYENVAQSERTNRSLRGFRRYCKHKRGLGAGCDSMANICDTTDKRR